MSDAATEVKEFDGGRSMWLSQRDGYIIMDFGEHCYAFEKGLLYHASKRALGITMILEEDLAGALVAVLTWGGGTGSRWPGPSRRVLTPWGK